MYRITANCASTHLAKRTRARHEELDEDSPVVDARPDHDPELQGRPRLRARPGGAEPLAELPPRLRAVDRAA